MTLSSDFDKLNYIFNRDSGGPVGGVIFPFFVPGSLDISSASAEILTDYSFPFKVRLVTTQAYPYGYEVSGAASVVPTLTYTKTTASIEPVVAVYVGTSGVASAGAATEVSLITCDALGTVGKTWQGTTTETTVDTTQSIWVAIKTAAAVGSYPSTGQDGLVKVILWLAILNSPA